MPIQWFPGHMNTAKKKAGETLSNIDVVIEVLDARLPEASSNPMIKALCVLHQRPCLKLLNKSDLADPVVTRAWLEFLNGQKGVSAVAISSKKYGEVAKVPARCRKLVPNRNPDTKTLRLLIMGIPNVGKSTFMNTLAKRRVALVGDEPAITKSQQRYDISPRMYIVDMPGLMWPKIEHDADGMMLAASHAIGRAAVLDEEVAAFLAGVLLDPYPGRLTERYGFATDGRHGRRRSHRAPARLPHQRPRRRAGSGTGLVDPAAGLPQRRAGPHQPGDARDTARHAGRGCNCESGSGHTR